jgi:hypothetical protein
MLRAIASLFLDVLSAGLEAPDSMLQRMVIYREASIRLLEIDQLLDCRLRHSQTRDSPMGTASLSSFQQLHDAMVALVEPMDARNGVDMKFIADTVKRNIRNSRWSLASLGDRQTFYRDYCSLVQGALARQGLDPREPTTRPKEKESPSETKNAPARWKTTTPRLRYRPRAEKSKNQPVNAFQPSSSMPPWAEASPTYATQECRSSGETRGPPGLPLPPLGRKVQAQRLHAGLQPRSTQDDTCDVSGGVHGHGTFSTNTLRGIRLCIYACHKVLEGLHAEQYDSDGVNDAMQLQHHVSQKSKGQDAEVGSPSYIFGTEAR